MGNVSTYSKVRNIDSKHNQWIYCDVCRIPIVLDAETENDYDIVNKLAVKDKATVIPLKFCHIVQDKFLYHVRDVRTTGDEFTYNQYKLPIKYCDPDK